MTETRISREIAQLQKKPIDEATFEFNDSDMYIMTCTIIGANDTPYEGGKFKIAISLPKEYPIKPPRVLFMTKIFHPNINTIGKICLNIIKEGKDGWLPAYRIETVIRAIQVLMSAPNTEDPLNNEAAQIWDNNIDLAHDMAKDWCQKYAK